MREELSVLIQAQYPLIYLVTFEEERAERAIASLAQQRSQQRVYTWTMTHGMTEYGHERASGQQNNTVSPQAAITWAMRQKEPSLFVFKDLHPFKDSPEVTRSLRDAIESFRGTQKTIILMSPVQEIPVELEKEVVVLDFSLPNMSELNQVLTAELSKSGTSSITTEGREKLLKAALGLTRDEAEK
ncbi:MAG: AAA family ATPase, partial [Cyanobacteria bacterium J06633_2]